MTKKSVLLCEAAQYMEKIKITSSERQELLAWVNGGDSVYDNPWHMVDENGHVMDFITAMRIAHDLKVQNMR